jgi:hypothetical protein
MEAQKNLNSQSNTEQKVMLEYHNTCSQIMLWSHSNKDHMVLAQKQTHR